MIGSKEIDVDGMNFNGDIIPVFRKGEWAEYSLRAESNASEDLFTPIP